jgi:sterol desaturase/sphingolipid hydroxylase (fatty acid hydroxylase superfamily)
MGWLSFEHSPGSYRADFCVYGTLLLALGMVLWADPLDPRLLGWMVAGAWGWTLLEYLLHRFVLHGLAPFKRWHLEHHRRPAALIAAPTLASAAVFASLLLPAVWLLGTRPAAALGVGLLGGYLVYGLIHHAVHRPLTAYATYFGWRWLLKRRLWHGLHHRRMHPAPGSRPSSALEGYYGVSTAFWDRLFRTDRRITSSACRWPHR